MRNVWRVGFRHGLLAFFAAGVLSFTLKAITGYTPTIAKFDGLTLDFVVGIILISTLVGVWFEEAVFRAFPLWVARKCSPDRKIHWIVAVVASLVFGYLHYKASVIHGQWQNVPIQGAAGLILCSAYLRSGYCASVVAHMIWNAMTILLLLLLAFLPL